MNYLNTIAVGRLTKDVKVFDNDAKREPLACFTMAVKIGQDRTSFIDVELRGDRVAKMAQYLVKGKEVTVDGLPFARGYEGQSGIGASLCLFANTIQLGSDPRSAESAAAATSSQPGAAALRKAPKRGRALAPASSDFEEDDTIPF